MNTIQLEHSLKNVEDFKGVYPIDLIPKKLDYPGFYIVNTAPSWHEGEHWVSFYAVKKGRSIFFDSYGKPPDHHIRKIVGKYVYNKQRMQSICAKTCGQFCLCFVTYISYGHSLKTFQSLFNSNLKQNDVRVSGFYKNHFDIIKPLPSTWNRYCVQVAKAYNENTKRRKRSIPTTYGSGNISKKNGRNSLRN